MNCDVKEWLHSLSDAYRVTLICVILETQKSFKKKRKGGKVEEKQRASYITECTKQRGRVWVW